MKKLARLRKDLGHGKAGALAIISGASGDLTHSLRCLEKPEPPLLARKGFHFDELELMQTKWATIIGGAEIEACTPVIVLERKGPATIVEIFGSCPVRTAEIPSENLVEADVAIICGFAATVAV